MPLLSLPILDVAVQTVYGNFLLTLPTCSDAKPSCETSQQCTLPVRLTAHKQPFRGSEATIAVLGRNYVQNIIGDCEQQSKSLLFFFL